MKTNHITYRSFLEEAGWTDLPLIREKVAELVENFKPAQQPISQFQPASYLLDYTKRKYLYVDDSWLREFGFGADWFLQNGLEGMLRIWHPDDLRVIDSIVFPDILSFYQGIPEEDYLDYVTTYNYRVVNEKNDCRTVLQRCSFIPQKNNKKPAGAVGVAFDITHYKTDNSIILTIEKLSAAKELFNELAFKKSYPVFSKNETCRLSQKELDVLKLMAGGMASKQIASELSLSIFTINNHRKNMLAKTGCRSASELMNFAAQHGLI